MLNTKPPYLAIDLGDRYIGTAFSEAGILVSAGETIDRQNKSDEQIFSQIASIIQKLEVKSFVIGLPINADGSENDRCRIIRDFIKKFENSTFYFLLSTFYFSEDFSSIDAKHQISQNFKLNQKSKTSSHPQAAKIILERFLESKS